MPPKKAASAASKSRAKAKAETAVVVEAPADPQPADEEPDNAVEVEASVPDPVVPKKRRGRMAAKSPVAAEQSDPEVHEPVVPEKKRQPRRTASAVSAPPAATRGRGKKVTLPEPEVEAEDEEPAEAAAAVPVRKGRGAKAAPAKKQTVPVDDEPESEAKPSKRGGRTAAAASKSKAKAVAEPDVTPVLPLEPSAPEPETADEQVDEPESQAPKKKGRGKAAAKPVIEKKEETKGEAKAPAARRTVSARGRKPEPESEDGKDAETAATAAAPIARRGRGAKAAPAAKEPAVEAPLQTPAESEDGKTQKETVRTKRGQRTKAEAVEKEVLKSAGEPEAEPPVEAKQRKGRQAASAKSKTKEKVEAEVEIADAVAPVVVDEAIAAPVLPLDGPPPAPEPEQKEETDSVVPKKRAGRQAAASKSKAKAKADVEPEGEAAAPPDEAVLVIDAPEPEAKSSGRRGGRTGAASKSKAEAVVEPVVEKSDDTKEEAKAPASRRAASARGRKPESEDGKDDETVAAPTVRRSRVAKAAPAKEPLDEGEDETAKKETVRAKRGQRAKAEAVPELDTVSEEKAENDKKEEEVKEAEKVPEPVEKKVDDKVQVVDELPVVAAVAAVPVVAKKNGRSKLPVPVAESRGQKRSKIEKSDPPVNKKLNTNSEKGSVSSTEKAIVVVDGEDIKTTGAEKVAGEANGTPTVSAVAEAEVMDTDTKVEAVTDTPVSSEPAVIVEPASPMSESPIPGSSSKLNDTFVVSPRSADPVKDLKVTAETKVDKPSVPDSKDEVPVDSNFLTIPESTAVVSKDSGEPVTTSVPAATSGRTTPKKRLLNDSPVYQPIAKRSRQETIPIIKRPDISGRLLTCGNDTSGELGLRQLGLFKRRPHPIPSLESDSFALVAAGAMHSLAVNTTGTKIFTFGCNDECALGRPTTTNGTAAGPDEDTNGDPDMTELINNSTASDDGPSEAAEAVPSFISLSQPVVKVTAGDSHSAALTDQGTLFIWGCFRAQSGRIGLTPATGREPVPTPVPLLVNGGEVIVDIASGDNHLIILTESGRIFTLGVGDQGALGRIGNEESAKFSEDGSNADLFLVPAEVKIKDEDDGHDVRCDAVWSGAFASFSRCASSGSIFAWGLNNYAQLGFPIRKNMDKQDLIVEFTPRKVLSFSRPLSSPTSSAAISSICGGSHHTLFLNTEGKIFSCGRGHYGRLGHGEEKDVCPPAPISALSGEKVTQIAAGTESSFAICDSGRMYSWGPKQSMQLGHSMPDDEEEGRDQDFLTPRQVKSKLLNTAVFHSVSVGAAHSLVIATLKPQSTTSS